MQFLELICLVSLFNLKFLMHVYLSSYIRCAVPSLLVIIITINITLTLLKASTCEWNMDFPSFVIMLSLIILSNIQPNPLAYKLPLLDYAFQGRFQPPDWLVSLSSFEICLKHLKVLTMPIVKYHHIIIIMIIVIVIVI